LKQLQSQFKAKREKGLGAPFRHTASLHVHDINKQVFVQHSDVVSYLLVIVIFYCGNTTEFHLPDGKFSEGVVRLYWVAKWVAV